MIITEIEAAKNRTNEVIRLLQSSNPILAEDLLNHLKSMVGWYATKENLYAIGELCHAKILGDNFIPELSHEEWFSLIGKLREECVVAFNILEQLPPDKREGV